MNIMHMQRAAFSDRSWKHLLALRDGKPVSQHVPLDPCIALYLPIAQRKKPLIMAQVGQSLDGRVATASGDAQDVSGCDGIAHLHRCRALVDAVIVGVGTVVADNPSLTVRAVEGSNPVRVVIDPNGRIPHDSKLLHDTKSQVLVLQCEDVTDRAPNAVTIPLPRQENGGLDVCDILHALSLRELTTILVEGGASTISRFIDAGKIDRLHVAVAPLIIGAGPSGISLPPIDKLAQAQRPKIDIYDIGSDIVFDCDLRTQA